MKQKFRSLALAAGFLLVGNTHAQSTVYDAIKAAPLSFFPTVETGVGLADRVMLGGTDRALHALHLSLTSTDSLATGTLYAALYETDALGGPGALFASSGMIPFSTPDFSNDITIPGASFGIGTVVLPEEFYVGIIFQTVNVNFHSILGFLAVPEASVSPGSNPAESYFRSSDSGMTWIDGTFAGNAIPLRIEAVVVPEASTWLLAAGALALAAVAARRRR